MVQGTMGCRWATYKIKLSCFMLLVLVPDFQRCFSLNFEGQSLLDFRSRINSDPFGALQNWNAGDKDPCLWSGVHCIDGVVEMLDLHGCCLDGTLTPELGNLTHLKSLILSKNHFYGVIPKQLGRLTLLEVLDLRNNKLSGTIPPEIGRMYCLRQLFLSNNSFVGSIPSEIVHLHRLTEMEFDMNLTPAAATRLARMNRKVGLCEWSKTLKSRSKDESLWTPIKKIISRYFDLFPVFGKGVVVAAAAHSYDNLPSPSKAHAIWSEQNKELIKRRKLAEQSSSSNLAAIPYNNGVPVDDVLFIPSSFTGSGSFPAVPKAKDSSPPPSTETTPATVSDQPSNNQTSTSGNNRQEWKYIVGISCGAFLIFAIASMLVMFYGRAAKDIRPWKSGLSGQLQKAFVTGVPKLNSTELETACEDFSNIIMVHDVMTVYKGTLSSGVEIAVASTAVASLRDWTKHAEVLYRKKIASLSRVNHKNFVNLIGYCAEDEPFVRMMVFEYAPNGTLFEHLHVKELEHLDWSARMRIIMGVGYCIQHMHGLDPPMVHSSLKSEGVYLTDDYAAKVVDGAFWAELVRKSKISAEIDVEDNSVPKIEEAEHDVYCFGLLLLETITGRRLQSDEYGSLLNWAQPYLNEKQKVSYLIDPSLQSFKNEELEMVCEVIQECTHPERKKRPAMKDVIAKLRETLGISPESATPRLSPLWWAELEILSSEAA